MHHALSAEVEGIHKSSAEELKSMVDSKAF